MTVRATTPCRWARNDNGSGGDFELADLKNAFELR